jgi:hypothetical protein
MEQIDWLVHKLREGLPGILADHPVMLAYLYGFLKDRTKIGASEYYPSCY